MQNDVRLNGPFLEVPKTYSLSLNIKEETDFVLNFIADANTEWEQMNKHNYPLDSDTIETLNVDYQILTEGTLDCFLRYNFSCNRLDTFLYNDYLCMELSEFSLDFKDPFFFTTVLRFEY